MLRASDGAVVAAHDSDAIGHTLRENGVYGSSNLVRFNTTATYTEVGWVHYGQRYYSPSLGRFINRDPIEEEGGINLYAFVGNNAVNAWDYLGMWGPEIIGMDGGDGVAANLGGLIAKASDIASVGATGAEDILAGYFRPDGATSPVEALAAQVGVSVQAKMDEFVAGQKALQALGLTLGALATEAGPGDLLAFSHSTGRAFAASPEAQMRSGTVTIGDMRMLADETLSSVAWGAAFDPSAPTRIRYDGPSMPQSSTNRLALSHAEQDRMAALGVFSAALELFVHLLPMPAAPRAATVIARAIRPTAATAAERGLGANPFKGKTFQQIDEMLTSRGFKKVGPDPASGKGSYFHPETGRKYYLDSGGQYKAGTELPHVDVHRLNSETLKRKYPLG